MSTVDLYHCLRGLEDLLFLSEHCECMLCLSVAGVLETILPSLHGFPHVGDFINLRGCNFERLRELDIAK